MPTSPLPNPKLRALSYWFVDGLPILLQGALSLLIAAEILGNGTFTHTTLGRAVSLAAVILYCVVAVRQRTILEWLKERITYPRTGYVTPPFLNEDAATALNLTTLSLNEDPSLAAEKARIRRQNSTRLWLSAAGVLAACFAVLLISNPWICTAAGLAMGLATWLICRETRQPLWIIIAGYPVFGFCMSTFLAGSIAQHDRAAYFVGAGGVLFILDGLVTLGRYLRQNPLPGASGQ
ncbi:MAG TPA: hypothetical protein VKF79_02190 [Candidatus Acidoferrum sp.]|nr:hypothetical protein [Candidatus Acidoferrum sp.]